MAHEHDFTIVLSPTDIALLSKGVRGRGGFQSLLRVLRRNIRGDKLTVTPAVRQRIMRYAALYGDGGFQRRLGGIAAALLR